MSRLCIRCCAALALLAGPALGRATMVSIFQNATNEGITFDADFRSPAHAKFRNSQANWDMSLGYTTDTSQSTNYMQLNLGNVAQLSSRTYAMTLANVAGQGVYWSLVDVNSAISNLLAWGTFSNSLPPATTSISREVLGTNQVSFTNVFYNTIRIEARSSTTNASGAPEDFFTVYSNLTFSSPTLAVAAGSLMSGVMTPFTNGAGDALGFNYQDIVADDFSNLDLHDWTLTGFLRLSRAGAGDGESWRFQVTFANALIPEPGASLAALCACGLLIFWLRRARR